MYSFFAGVRSCTMHINYLPPEVLTKIFSYLPQHGLLTAVNIVCLYWNEVAFSNSLWKTIDITDSTDDDLDIYLQNIAHYKDFVQNLLIKSDHLMKFFDIGKNLNLSNLTNLQIMNYLPYKEVRFCKYIVDLYPGIVSIRFRIFRSADIFGCLSVLSNLQLRDFDIYTSRGGDTMALNKIISEFISKQCSLQSLSIHCSELESETIRKLLKNKKDLTCLDLSNSTGVDDCVFTALPELSKLTALDLTDTTVNDEGLKDIATKASHLKTLSLMFCTKLSDIGIGYIADDCHCLESLLIVNISDKISGVRLFPDTMETLGKGCQKLKHLTLGNCSRLDDSGVFALVQNCRDLGYLELQSKNISTPSLHAISHFCSNLFHLEIDGYNFNAASVESLLANNRFIKYVSIGNCSDIDTIDLCKSTETKSGILKTHSHASTLFINGQTQTGYSAIEQIVTFCPDLRELSLPPINTAVHDNVIEIAFHKCRFLQTLTLDHSETINRTDIKTNLK